MSALDQKVVTFYRKLIKHGFEHAGILDSPAIFLDSIGENVSVCASVTQRYLNLYIAVENATISDVRYLCTCDPTGNVAVEILCSLIKGKSIDYAKTITIDDFYEVLGGEVEDLRKSADGLLELLQRGIARYENGQDS